jgi:hypothetical protein
VPKPPKPCNGGTAPHWEPVAELARPRAPPPTGAGGELEPVEML